MEGTLLLGTTLLHINRPLVLESRLIVSVKPLDRWFQSSNYKQTHIRELLRINRNER